MSKSRVSYSICICFFVTYEKKFTDIVYDASLTAQLWYNGNTRSAGTCFNFRISGVKGSGILIQPAKFSKIMCHFIRPSKTKLAILKR